MAAEARSFRSDGGADSPAPALSLAPARMTPLRELQLLETHKAGGPDSHKALTELLGSYQRRIYSICLRMVRRPEDAADLTQDVLLKLVESLPSYDGRSKLSTWVIRVAMNAAISHLRRQKTRQTQSLDLALQAQPASAQPDRQPPSEPRTRAMASREPSAAQSVEQEQQRMLVLRALDGLDDDTRAILVLRDMHDMDYQQLAEALDVPVGTIKSRLFRARAAFRQAFESLTDREVP